MCWNLIIHFIVMENLMEKSKAFYSKVVLLHNNQLDTFHEPHESHSKCFTGDICVQPRIWNDLYKMSNSLLFKHEFLKIIQNSVLLFEIKLLKNN